MQLTKEKQRELASKLSLARLSLMEKHPFYAILLLNMSFSLDLNAETAYTDGTRIAFDPVFLDGLSKDEVCFVLMHEILHCALDHVHRGEIFDHEAFNLATDVVVNSTILRSCGGDLSSITLAQTGEAIHRLPDGREGWELSAEEAYPYIYNKINSKEGLSFDDLTSKGKGKNKKEKKSEAPESPQPVDNHDHWSEKPDEYQRQVWLDRMIKATDLVASMEANGLMNGCGDVPAFMERIIKELRQGGLDWKTLLNDFVQEDLCDYSYNPPDRRFSDSDFFYPDFNVRNQTVKNVLFMVDTSGSIDDEMLNEAYSEINGAINQFDYLEGKVGFFDSAFYEPVSFNDVNSLLDIKPKGGGGTSFLSAFEGIRKYTDRENEEVSSIIILTDGYCPFPDEEAAGGIPVLWLINNDKITPPWGRIARIKPPSSDPV